VSEAEVERFWILPTRPLLVDRLPELPEMTREFVIDASVLDQPRDAATGRARDLIPVVACVVPTVAIGYGVVLPRNGSGITGVKRSRWASPARSPLRARRTWTA
jgi:hypothetical protein